MVDQVVSLDTVPDDRLKAELDARLKAKASSNAATGFIPAPVQEVVPRPAVAQASSPRPEAPKVATVENTRPEAIHQAEIKLPEKVKTELSIFGLTDEKLIAQVLDLVDKSGREFSAKKLTEEISSTSALGLFSAIIPILGIPVALYVSGTSPMTHYKLAAKVEQNRNDLSKAFLGAVNKVLTAETLLPILTTVEFKADEPAEAREKRFIAALDTFKKSNDPLDRAKAAVLLALLNIAPDIFVKAGDHQAFLKQIQEQPPESKIKSGLGSFLGAAKNILNTDINLGFFAKAKNQMADLAANLKTTINNGGKGLDALGMPFLGKLREEAVYLLIADTLARLENDMPEKMEAAKNAYKEPQGLVARLRNLCIMLRQRIYDAFNQKDGAVRQVLDKTMVNVKAAFDASQEKQRLATANVVSGISNVAEAVLSESKAGFQSVVGDFFKSLKDPAKLAALFSSGPAK